VTINNKEILSSADKKTTLEKLIDEHGKNINKNNKFKIITGTKSHFLPEVKDLLDFFDIHADAKALYQALKERDIEIPHISNSSLHELGRNGVGRTVFKKFIETMITVAPSIGKLLIPGNDEWVDRIFKTNSNAAGWYGLIRQCRLMENDEKYDQQELAVYQNVIDFINLRSRQDVEFYELIQRKKLSGEIDLDDKSNVWEKEIKPFYQQCTNLNRSTLELIALLFIGEFEVSKLTNLQKIDAIQKVFEIEYDFLLNCIACYEVGYVSQQCDSSDLKEWILSKTLTTYSKPDNTATCFRCLMDVLLSWLEEQDIKINNRQLASCIPINFQNIDDEDGEEGKNDAQCNKLYKWYRSIDLPSNKSLLEFFDNLADLTQYPIDNGPFNVAKIAIGFDKLLLEKSEAIKIELGSDIDTFVIWKRALSRYPDYYRYHWNQH